MRRRLVTINVVAAEAGVSASTVSRVLNGRAGKVGISARLCERVHAAAERLHYAPNHAAQSLARQRTGVIALLLWRRSDSLCADIAAGITTVANRHGYQLSVIDAGADEVRVTERALRHLESGTCDGVIMASGSDCPHEHAVGALTALIDQGVTLVLVLDRSRVSTVPTIDIDNAGGTYLATKHLLGLGHRRIAHFTVDGASLAPDDPHPPGARYRGYLSALDEAGLEAEPSWVFRGCPTIEGGRDMARALLARFPTPARRPTAVVAFNDEIAIGVLRGVYEAGLRVPDEIALVGFGGTPSARFTIPALTTIEHPRVAVGERAAETLFALLEGSEIQPREHLVPVTLAIRESCGARPRPGLPSPLYQVGGGAESLAPTPEATVWRG
jgi:LacI family transcriptional regulator